MGGVPLFPVYIYETIKTKTNAKDILEILFENGWDINHPMGPNGPPDPLVSQTTNV